MLSWGGTYGACATAVHNVQAEGKAVTHCHLRYLNPLPKDLGDILKRFKKVLIPELNLGQLRTIDPRQVPGRCDRPEQSARQAVQRGRGGGQDRSRCSAAIRQIHKLRRSRWNSEAPPKAVLEKVAHGG